MRQEKSLPGSCGFGICRKCLSKKEHLAMSSATKVWDPAFQGAGQRLYPLRTEIWRIENFQPVPLPKSEYGKFYMGDSYIILQTTQGKGGAYYYDLHFWIGKDTSQ
ncbi:villin-2-like protein, partial [Trifolium pratense]